MKVEGMINISQNPQNFQLKKEGQGNIKSEIDVANVLLQLKEKDEQETDDNTQENNESINSYQKKLLVEKLYKKKSLNGNFKNSPVSIASLNNESNEHNNSNIYQNNNPYRSPSSTVYSSPVISQLDKMDNDFRSIKEEPSNKNINYLPPIKYLLETKVVNSSMKDNILPIPDIPSYRNRMNHMSDHLIIKSYAMEMNKDDLLYYKSFSNQPNDYKVSRKSSYSSMRENENNYNIPGHQNNNMQFMYENQISRSNPSPNSDHMYNNAQAPPPKQPVVSLPPPSMMMDSHNYGHQDNTNPSSYPQYQSSSFYNNSNTSILSEPDTMNRNTHDAMNLDPSNNRMMQGNNFDSIDINKTIKLCTNNGPNANNISTKRFGPIQGKKKEKESRRFPKYIIQILEASYNASHYPSNNEKDRLVRDTKLTHRQINDWFINKRARSSCNHQNKRRNLKKLKQQQQQQQQSQS